MYTVLTHTVYDIYNWLSKHILVSMIHESPEKPPFMPASSINTALVTQNNTYFLTNISAEVPAFMRSVKCSI